MPCHWVTSTYFISQNTDVGTSCICSSFSSNIGYFIYSLSDWNKVRYRKTSELDHCYPRTKIGWIQSKEHSLNKLPICSQRLNFSGDSSLLLCSSTYASPSPRGQRFQVLPSLPSTFGQEVPKARFTPSPRTCTEVFALHTKWVILYKQAPALTVISCTLPTNGYIIKKAHSRDLVHQHTNIWPNHVSSS